LRHPAGLQGGGDVPAGLVDLVPVASDHHDRGDGHHPGDGGIILLDEFGGLPVEAQVTLLWVAKSGSSGRWWQDILRPPPAPDVEHSPEAPVLS
jgi:hypothetical protein